MAELPNNIVKLVTALVGPAQDIENALQQLLVDRSIDTAVGAQLDVLGKIVGQARGGLVDDDYRRYIRARVAAHRSHGTREELIRIADLVLDITTTGVVIIRTEADATFILEVHDHAVTDAVAAALQNLLVSATAAGVRIVIVYSRVALASTFQFDVAGHGFDQGHLARSIDESSTI